MFDDPLPDHLSDNGTLGYYSCRRNDRLYRSLRVDAHAAQRQMAEGGAQFVTMEDATREHDRHFPFAG